MSKHWKAYESCMSAAKRSREYAVHFANHKDWRRAYGHAATAKTAQANADKYFNFYLDALALNDVCNTTERAQRRTRARVVVSAQCNAGDHASVRDAGDTSPDMGISVGDLARDAKDPRDIYS